MAKQANEWGGRGGRILCVVWMVALAKPFAGDLTRYVDAFIGTGGSGNTFPGAVVPWGMVSVSPHTDLEAPSGYVHGEPYFYGLGHVHLSGTGCADLGSVILMVKRGNIGTKPASYRSAYRDENATPGYYSVRLEEPSLTVEVTSTIRSGLTRFTPGKDGKFTILIDAGRSLVLRKGGKVHVVSPEEIEGYNLSGGFCGEDNRHTVYFVARFSEEAVERGVWKDDLVLDANRAANPHGDVGAWMVFKGVKGRAVQVKIGISYVSIDNARENLEKEIPAWDFDRIQRAAETAWNEQLEKVQFEGGSHKERIKFYTALYHMLIHPSIISDVSGEYPRMGHTGVGQSKDRERYSVLSLWDTYRTLHPFLTLVYPGVQSQIIQSMLDIYRESGWLPKWELMGSETYMMVGDPAAIVIADSYAKGIRDFSVETALEAMLRPTRIPEGESAPPVRAGYHQALEYGYIPFEQDTTEAWWVWGPVSTTLEYCLADWAIATTARRLGRDDLAEQFQQRARFYRNLFDPGTQFMRPRRKDRSWLHPFHPEETEGSGSWQGSGGPGYVEGSAWHYTWFVPHDMRGLIELFGGTAPFKEKLSRFFEENHFTVSNEPDLAYPYLFNYVPGEEYRTARLVHEIMAERFSTGPRGLPGNDDAGTISAWFVFSALGFYPVCAGSPVYQLGAPLFRRAVIRLDPGYYQGGEFIVEVEGRKRRDMAAKAIMMNGSPLNSRQIAHDQITAGGTLVYQY